MIAKSIIGKEYPPFTVEVEKRWVRRFAEAIGETNPVYLDESVARAGGYPSLPAPPTFPFAIIMDRNQSFIILDELGIDKRRAMHGEQSFAYHTDICAGDMITGRQRVIDVYDKKNGALEFLPGDVITCSGNINGKREQAGEKLVDLELVAQNQKGENIQLGKATVALT